MAAMAAADQAHRERGPDGAVGDSWPSSVWLGTSVENQKYADLRIPVLLEIPAAVRFLSCEPLLGHVDIGLTEEWGECTCGTGPAGYYGMHEQHCGLTPGPAESPALGDCGRGERTEVAALRP